MSASDARDCIRAHLFGLLCTYVVEGRPRVDPERLKAGDDSPPPPPSMEEIRRRFLEDEAEVPDEHTAKLVQVCHLLEAEGAGPTEGAGPASELCRLAALTAMENPFNFNSIVGR